MVQFAFGGGGGGGMTSFLLASLTVAPAKAPGPTAQSGLGAGGGGGAQFANGYWFDGTSYNGLGLGAGVGNTDLDPDAPVQYSYNDYPDSPRQPPPPVHEFNAGIVADYEAQLENLAGLLKSKYRDGKTIVIRGGGGMGGGTDYLSSGGLPHFPRALSTQGGFQFNYEFARTHPASNSAGAQALDNLNAEQQNIYEAIGDAYQIASDLAYQACGRNYANFACMCPIEHTLVICIAAQKVGDPTKVPGWLQQRHCPGDDPGNGPDSFSAYQRHLLAAAGTINDAHAQPTCRTSSPRRIPRSPGPEAGICTRVGSGRILIRHADPAAISEVAMNHRLFPALVTGAVLGCAVMPAHAVICYEIIDRNDAVVYRDTTSPVDLSEAGARSRAAMRDRGDLLLIFETESCMVAGRLTGSGSRKLTVDEIVAEWQGKWGTGNYGMWSPSYDHRPSPSTPSAAPASAQPMAPAGSPIGRAQRASPY